MLPVAATVRCLILRLNSYALFVPSSDLHVFVGWGFQSLTRLLNYYTPGSRTPVTTVPSSSRLAFELFCAAEDGVVATVRQLLNDGVVSLHHKGFDNWTVLHFSARRGHVDVVREVLARDAHKALLDAVTKNAWTPLHMAAAQGHVEIVDVLLAAGANARLLNKQGHSALDLATLPRLRQVLAMRMHI